MAQGVDLTGSVLPFILRNVTLAGIDSVDAPADVRALAWSRLARDLDLSKLRRTSALAPLSEVPSIAARIDPRIVRGHEPCGVIVAVGSGVTSPYAQVGARVMVHHYHGCTVCDDCRSGWAHLCQEVPVEIYGDNANGAHAPYLKVPADTLVPLHEQLSFAAGAAISCGTGTAWGALERMNVTGREMLAIFGQGPVGISGTMLAKAQGARVIAIDIDPERLARATAAGADVVINARNGSSAEAILQATRGRGVDMVMETSGSVAAWEDALRATAVWGTICMVGIGAEVKMSLANLLRRQLRILTSWTMSIQSQRACAQFCVDRGIDVDSIFTDSWKLEQAEEAYRKFDLQSGGKGVFLL